MVKRLVTEQEVHEMADEVIQEQEKADEVIQEQEKQQHGEPLAVVRVTYKDGTHIEVKNVIQPYVQEKQGFLAFPVYGYGFVTVSLADYRTYEIAAMRSDGEVFRPVREHFELDPKEKPTLGFKTSAISEAADGI